MTPNPRRFFVPALIAAGLFSIPVTGAAAEDPIYTVLGVPVALPTAGSINNKSQVASTRVVGTGVMLDIWLPAADYGLEAGVHTYPVPFDLPGLISPTTGIAVKRFADNGTVYLTNGSYAELTFHDGVFAALIGFVAGRSDLFNGINMSANGIIYAKPWDPLTGSPGYDDASRYLKTGPGHPREEYHGPPNPGAVASELVFLGSGNSHGVQMAGSSTRVGTWNGAFTELALPGSGRAFGADINDKGQLILNGYIYLPAGDYGRGGGFHAFSFTPGPNNAQVSSLSGHGEIYGRTYPLSAPSTQFFSIEHDKVINLSEALAPGTAATITHILEINENGVILAMGTLDGTPNKLLLVNPPPEETFSITVPPGRYVPGDIITATIRVSNPILTDLTVTMDHPLVVVDDPTLLEMVDEIEVEPFVLNAANPSRVFTVQLLALEHGVTEVYASAVSVDSENTVHQLVDAAPVSISPLRMTIRALPLVGGRPIVNLEIDDEGNITDEDGNAVSPKVEVKIENVSAKPVKVFVQGVDPRARDRSAALGRIHVAGEFPLELGVLEPGNTFTREFGLEIHQDGRFEFKVFVSGSVEGWPGGISVSDRGAPIAVGDPYPVELELDFVRTPAITNQNNGAFFVEPGSTFRVLAKVENLTTNSTLEFYGIRAEKQFNAFGAVLTSDEGNLSVPPLPGFLHDHEVDPGATLVLSGSITTEADGAATGTVIWQGLEDAVLVDDQTGVKTELEADDVLVTSELGSWLNNDLAVRIVQDHSRPEKPSLDGSEVFAVWSHGTLVGVGEWMHDTLDAFGGIGRLAGSISADPSLLGDSMGSASRAVWEAAELAAVTWNNMSEDEREAFIRSKVAEITRRAYLLASTRTPFDPNDANLALEYTRSATYSLFGGVSDAYASDDPAQIAAMWGRVSGHVGMEVLTSALPTPEFGAYTKAADAALQAKNKSIAPAVTSQEIYLRALKAGPVDEAVTLRGWGIAGPYLSDIKDLMRRFGVKGYCRERSASAHRLIDEQGEAVWKMESMKPKGINELDALILDNDFPPIIGKNGQDLGANGITGIYMPPSDDVIKARLVAQNRPQPVIDAALRHAQHRREEFAEYLPKFEKWSKPVSDEGGIPVALNYKDNGIPNPVGQGPNRQFHYQKLEREGKPTLYIPRVMNADGTAFRYISGDVDWVHFSFLNGSPLDPETAARFYDAMVRSCGMQHPETITWFLEGQSVFKGKVNQIVDYLRGQKPLLEVSGESTRAVFISKSLTRFSNTTRNHLIFFEGGIRSRARASLADIENAFHHFQKRFPDRRIVAPFLWLQKDDQLLDDTTIGGKEWTFTTSDDALLLRQTADDGSLEQFDGTNWVAFDLAQQPAPLALTPATATAAVSAAGDTVIEIEDLASLWPAQLVGHLDNWFEAGQTVIIAPGEEVEEIRQVVGLGSLILDRPLQYDHPQGTHVAVIQLTDESAPLITLHPSTAAITAGGTATLTVEAIGAGPFTYQWYRNGAAIPGATTSTFMVPSAQAFHQGDYTVTVTNAFGEASSNTGILSVAALPPSDSRLLNLSARGLAGAGANQLFPGFVISGTGTKRLLIRAVGPSLADLGFPGAVMPNPRMELKRFNFTTNVYEDVITNDDWELNANAADIVTTSADLFAFALTDSRDAALLVDLMAGQYAVVGGDKDDGSGIGIVELYDADPGTPTSRLINISNRGFVGVGDQVMIPGFVVSSEGPKTLLVRVVGPTLGGAPYNVPGTMTDPKLEIYPGGASTPILTNDNWGDNPAAAYTAQVAANVFAFPLAAGSADAAFVVSLPPGAYTVVGSAADGVSTGVVLVEVYVVP